MASGNVTLREKPLSKGKKSLFLDIVINGKRKKEYLKLYLYNPTTPAIRAENKKTKELAKQIKAKREIEIASNAYGIDDTQKLDTLFLDYFKALMEERKDSKGNYGNWISTYKHLQDFCGEGLTFRQIDVDFVKELKEYFQKSAKTKSNSLLSVNSQSSYFNKFRAALNQAVDDGIIFKNPASSVKTIKSNNPERVYLTIEELKLLVATPCDYPVLKKAFIFSCLTGIRWSDINKMRWSEVLEEKDGVRIVFEQKKTKSQEYLDINNQAATYLGERGAQEAKVFKGLKYSGYNNIRLQNWIYKAGIQKKITFHCARHTFAVMQIELETDIYTVSKLLGHKEIKTTQIYAKVLDKAKKIAVNKIPNIGI